MVAAAASSGWSGGEDEGGAADERLLAALLMGDSAAAVERVRVEEVEEEEKKKKKKKKKKPSCWPPGFRFHPTDEELVLYYLKRKICGRRIRLHMIAVVDVYKCEPWELPEKSILQTGDKQWYFFSPRDRKYPNGCRSNRATNSGYWKATGKDRAISHNSRIVGMKKTLVFYRGRAPKGERTDWVMHEYTIDELELMKLSDVKDSFAIYKVFQKSGPGPRNGEQYGAPFREDEWADDDPVDGTATGLVNEGNASLMLSSVDVFATPQNHVQDPPPMDELEMFLMQVENDLEINQMPSNLQQDCLANITEVVDDTEIPSHLLESTLIEESPNETDVWVHHESVVREATFQISQYAPIQPSDILEATSEFNYKEGDENKLEDFLEITDLGDSGASIQPLNDASNESFLYENDLFFDPCEDFPTMFLSEAAGTLDQMAIHPYQGGLSENGIQHEEVHITSQLWAYDHNPDTSAVFHSNQSVAAPPPSGILGSSTSQGQRTQEQGGNVEGTSDSWFNLWSTKLINAVPTRPAFASENEFVGRALQRVSSFRAGRVEPRNQEVVRGGGTNVRRGESRDNGFLFLSCLVALGAVCWVLTIGAILRVLKAVVGRFVSS